MTDAPCHVLVVDDDPLIRMAAVDLLEEAGFKALEAAHADEALQILAQHPTEIVLLFSDVQMPGSRNGFELARLTAESWPHIAIVVASGHLKPGDGELPEAPLSC